MARNWRSPIFKKKSSSLIIHENVSKMMVFRVSSQNYSKDFLEIAYVNRRWCILSNAKNRRSKKFSFYFISHIDGVKRCKNWFLSQLLEFIGSVWSDTLYYESIELSLEAEDCVSHVCMFFPFFLFFIFCWCWHFLNKDWSFFGPSFEKEWSLLGPLNGLVRCVGPKLDTLLSCYFWCIAFHCLHWYVQSRPCSLLMEFQNCQCLGSICLAMIIGWHIFKRNLSFHPCTRLTVWSF